MRLLVAEDNKAAKAHRSALKRRGHIVIVASNGEDCIKIYNDKLQAVSLYSNPDEQIQPFDVVVLGNDIPKMNGIKVTKKILTINLRQSVILISGNDNATSRSLGQLKQKVHILEKPTEQMLIEKVKEVNIYSTLGELNIDIDNFKKAHFTNEQLKKVLWILKKRKEIKPRPV